MAQGPSAASLRGQHRPGLLCSARDLAVEVLGLGREAAPLTVACGGRRPKRRGPGRPGGRWLIFTRRQCVPSPSGMLARSPAPPPTRWARIPGMGSCVGISRTAVTCGGPGGGASFCASLSRRLLGPGRLQARWAQVSVQGGVCLLQRRYWLNELREEVLEGPQGREARAQAPAVFLEQ